MRTVFIGAQENPNGINSYTYNLALELCNRGYKSMVMAFGSCDKVTDYKGIVTCESTIGNIFIDLK